MGKKPETIFSEKFYKAFSDRFGSKGFIENIQQVGKVGTPDYLGVISGMFIAFELKVDGGKIAPLQLIKLAQFKKAGGLAYIVTPQNYIEILDELEAML